MKYLIYAIVILIVLFLVDALGIYDVPYIDAPNFFSGKQELLQRSTDGLKGID